MIALGSFAEEVGAGGFGVSDGLPFEQGLLSCYVLETRLSYDAGRAAGVAAEDVAVVLFAEKGHGLAAGGIGAERRLGHRFLRAL